MNENMSINSDIRARALEIAAEMHYAGNAQGDLDLVEQFQSQLDLPPDQAAQLAASVNDQINDQTE